MALPHLLLRLRKIPSPRCRRFPSTFSGAVTPFDASAANGLRGRCFSSSRCLWDCPCRCDPLPASLLLASFELCLATASGDEDEADATLGVWRPLARPQSSMSCISFCAIDNSFGCSPEAPVCHVTLRSSRPEAPVYHSTALPFGECRSEASAELRLPPCGVCPLGPPTVSAGACRGVRAPLLSSVDAFVFAALFRCGEVAAFDAADSGRKPGERRRFGCAALTVRPGPPGSLGANGVPLEAAVTTCGGVAVFVEGRMSRTLSRGAASRKTEDGGGGDVGV